MSSLNEISTILSTLRMESDPELAPLFYQFEEFYTQKLYHQLTQSLDIFFQDPKSAPLRLRVYDTFVSKFVDKINQLSVVEFLLLALKNHHNNDESLKYLTLLDENFKAIDEKKQRNDGLKNHKSGSLLISIEKARIYLFKNEPMKARDLLDELEQVLDKQDTTPLRVTNAFYSVNADYYKRKNDFNTFYYTSLLYLSSLPPNEQEITDVNINERKELAYDLSVAALLGDRIYNFGELLQHPIISVLKNDSHYEWLFHLLNALSVGDFNKFDNYIKVQISNIPILAENESFLRQKICLMALVESVFAKNIRTLSFDDISKATHLEFDNVEHLIMKAISLGLLKGIIDQVNQLVSITWVQPRIISGDQITKMKDRLVEWDEQVTILAKKIDAKGKPLWV
ncbi:hypothetical protein TBLA_0D01600 [Henningerozyma blattae CBS 6284]|uniref:PCI domain-containing protein n=1 Tax=Henningerozyma blattae (strain ATCC 34711 / CBS 6284 / DSM 70876 / NBRC 10599 / NRRL Y-10934 / UCD 77-7) TaxID=1071380 RepID=I2H2R6_HENB6|nr:hypothetical protein TBLA_0D01600 [Tetrapisispora blattae CBS 6284]CCH60668.1 hypothetical protein TBLA_0D01600 [Tetrapisispora blattae CBS 6284]